MYPHVHHVRGFENVSRVSGNSVFLPFGLLLFDSKADCRPMNELLNFGINRLMGYVNISKHNFMYSHFGLQFNNLNNSDFSPQVYRKKRIMQ